VKVHFISIMSGASIAHLVGQVLIYTFGTLITPILKVIIWIADIFDEVKLGVVYAIAKESCVAGDVACLGRAERAGDNFMFLLALLLIMGFAIRRCQQ
jgi:hypothetical protein